MESDVIYAVFVESFRIFKSSFIDIEVATIVITHGWIHLDICVARVIVSRLHFTGRVRIKWVVCESGRGRR